MYKKILVPVDVSHKERGKAMLGAAKKFADDGATVTLISVIEDVPSYVQVQLPEAVLEQAKASARADLKALASASNLTADVEVRRGRAHTIILDYAAESGTDLIIVASHKPGLQDFLLGSTAARVVRHATCSVLVTR